MNRFSCRQRRMLLQPGRLIALPLLAVLSAAGQPPAESESPAKQSSEQHAESDDIAAELTKGLVAYYPFEGTLEDASGNRNHGTPHGLVEFGEGKIGQAVQLLGDDDRGFITVKTSESLTFDEAMTVACWFRIDDDAGQTGENHTAGKVAKAHHVLVAKHGDIAGFTLFSLGEQNDHRQVAMIAQNHSPDEVGVTFPPDQRIGAWQHLASTADENGVRLYLNGKLVGATRALVHLDRVNQCDLFIGINGPVGLPSDPEGFLWFPLNGAIDDVRLYNRSLSQKEIRVLAAVEPADDDVNTALTADRLPDFGPEQATGLPDAPNRREGHPTAWASRTADEQDEWLILEYATAVEAKGVIVYETSNAGAINKVGAFDADGQEVEVWAGRTPRTPSRDTVLPSVLYFNAPLETNRVKIYVNSSEHPGFNQIDAVGLRDVSGNVQWAVKATASSVRTPE